MLGSSSHIVVITLYICLAKFHINHVFGINYQADNTSMCLEGRYLTRSICLRKNYEVTATPFSEEKLTKVYTDVTIKGIREVNDKKRIMVIDVKIVFSWSDERIMHDVPKYKDMRDEIQLDRQQSKQIWKPEIYIYNLSKFDILKVSNPITRVSIVSERDLHEANNTMIRYVLEGSASVYCNFNHDNYPMVNQRCQLQISSHIGNIDFILRSKDVLFNDGSGDFKMDIEFYNQYLRGDCYQRVVGVDVHMQRFMQPFLMKYYLPSVSIVIVCGISFIIPLTSLPARVALLVTQFLTLTNIFIHQQVSSSDVCVLHNRYI
jgi:hypothetical protein